MLIKVTNQCEMSCSHCMENSRPNTGEHMTEDVFGRALDFTERIEKSAWDIGIPPRILLSGGECTEHPLILSFIEKVFARGWLPILITNGMWLANDELRASILRPEWDRLFVQVTHDPRFYPKPIQRFDDRRIVYIEELTNFIALGRGTKKRSHGVPFRKAPGSFNLRSLTRHTGSFEKAVFHLRARAAVGASGNCVPSITHEGYVMAGETRNCFQIGTVDSTETQLTATILAMGPCNRCGLEDNLNKEQRIAIGLPVVNT